MYVIRLCAFRFLKHPGMHPHLKWSLTKGQMEEQSHIVQRTGLLLLDRGCMLQQCQSTLTQPPSCFHKTQGRQEVPCAHNQHAGLINRVDWPVSPGPSQIHHHTHLPSTPMVPFQPPSQQTPAKPCCNQCNSRPLPTIWPVLCHS